MEYCIEDNNNPDMRRLTANTNSVFTSHLSAQYMENSHNIWGQCSLKPSTSIWGNKIQPQAQNQHQAQPHSAQTTFTHDWEMPHALSSHAYPSIPLGGVQGSLLDSSRNAYNTPRSSIPSLSSSGTSSPLWFEDPYPFSPPQSPDALAKVEHEHSHSVNIESHPARNLNSGAQVPKQQQSAAVAPIGSAVQSRRPSVESVKATQASPSASPEKMVISCSCGPLYVVQFKGCRRDVFTAPGTTTYSVGDAVMVDADRGRDLGIITQANVSRHDAAALKQQQHSDRQLVLHSNSGSSSPTMESGSSTPTVYTPKQILGNASVSEIKDLSAKVEDEENAVQLCNKKANERNLDMEIVDAEYQWDRRKLTFFYTANSRVDFRDLVRELFRIYKTRIWMCATTARN